MRSFIRYCLHHAKRRHTVNNNTLCDARKLQKNAVSRCIIRIFVQKSHVSFHGLISIYPSFYIAGYTAAGASHDLDEVVGRLAGFYLV